MRLKLLRPHSGPPEDLHPLPSPAQYSELSFLGLGFLGLGMEGQQLDCLVYLL